MSGSQHITDKSQFKSLFLEVCKHYSEKQENGNTF